ncbi:MAG: flagellar filament capping protein FliD [Betaproteobacteria bacterium]
MASIDYINALGAGASFDTKKIVEALVDAERAGAEQQIQRKLADAESKISGLGSAASILSILKEGAELLNDARDFNTLSIGNSNPSALKATVTSSARAGSNTVSIQSLAKEQRSVSSGFDSSTTQINGSNTTNVTLTIDGVDQVVSVEGATLSSISEAINEANLGVRAEIVNTGEASGNFKLQLIGETGANNSFSVSSDFGSLTFATNQTATNASLTVNGISFTRESNQISDVIQGVNLNLTSTTDSNFTLTVDRDTSEAKGNIIAFVSMFNEASQEFRNLTNSETDGSLRGDSIFRSIVRNMRSIVIGTSTSPGSSVSSLSDIGISIDRNGQLLFDEAKLDTALNDNYEDVISIFTADTNDQSRFSDDPAGIAGDLKNLIERVTASDGYLVTAEQALQTRTVEYNKELTALEERMKVVEERYNRQFLVMQNIIEEMNSTKESLIASFENLPFSNKND